MLRLALIYAFCFAAAFLCAQSENPFDLTSRTPADVTPSETDTAFIIIEDSLDKGEEFIPEIDVSETAEHKIELTKPIAEEPAIKERKETSFSSKKLTNKQKLFYLGLFFLMLLLLSIIISYERDSFKTIYRCFSNDNYLNLVYRQYKKGLSIVYYLYYTLFWINLALFLYLVTPEWNFYLPLYQWLLVVAIVYLFRHTMLKLLGSVFSISKETNQFHFTIVIFNILLGVLLFPINITLVYAPVEIFSPLMYTGITLIILMYLLRQFRGLFLAGKHVIFHFFHFFIYLCAVEIAPVFVLIKVLGLLEI